MTIEKRVCVFIEKVFIAFNAAERCVRISIFGHILAESYTPYNKKKSDITVIIFLC